MQIILTIVMLYCYCYYLSVITQFVFIYFLPTHVIEYIICITHDICIMYNYKIIYYNILKFVRRIRFI
jgi:hypothetical protein